MNIDIEKLIKHMDKIGTSVPYVNLATIKSFEIKTGNRCNTCSGFELNKYCFECVENPNLNSFFEPKHNELDNLFIGAPVMVDVSHDCRPDWANTTYCHELAYPIRLPTVEEAPRNVWLAPWINMPEELIDLRVLLKGDNGEIRSHYAGRCEPNNVNWRNVEAVMILQDFEK